MTQEALDRIVISSAKHKQLIIVSTGGQVCFIRSPFQTTYLLLLALTNVTCGLLVLTDFVFMRFHLLNEITRFSDVPPQYAAVSAARHNRVTKTSQGSNTSRMSSHCSNSFAGLTIPDMHQTVASA
eukprot:m.11935 g.11935  ORF g.11935 m.11935 type:complete len:126 (-) comp4559_c0_seq2:958-1335(-)